jgi:hypothetical protein
MEELRQSISRSVSLTINSDVCTIYAYIENMRRGAAMLFEWDERKRQANLAKHRIDFQDVMRVFDGPVFEKVVTVKGRSA